MATKNSYQFRGPKPPDWYEGNGCGALGTGILDWLLKRLGVPIGPACRRHDWHYEVIREGDDYVSWRDVDLKLPAASREEIVGDFDRALADEWFQQNIRILSQAEARSLRSAKRKKVRNWAKSLWREAAGGIVSVVAYRVVRRLGKYTL